MYSGTSLCYNWGLHKIRKEHTTLKVPEGNLGLPNRVGTYFTLLWVGWEQERRALHTPGAGLHLDLGGTLLPYSSTLEQVGFMYMAEDSLALQRLGGPQNSSSLRPWLLPLPGPHFSHLPLLKRQLHLREAGRLLCKTWLHELAGSACLVVFWKLGFKTLPSLREKEDKTNHQHPRFVLESTNTPTTYCQLHFARFKPGRWLNSVELGCCFTSL